jgi:DNA-binding GntR family transcriptional regulator
MRIRMYVAVMLSGMVTALRRSRTTMQIPDLAFQIAEHIRSSGLPNGTKLSGRKLAEQFRVSRSPIERALRLLEEHKIILPSDKGYVVNAVPSRLSPVALGATSLTADDALYLRLATEHESGQFDGKTSESELIRRYGASRATIVRILQRASGEGWVERLPGHGWAFVPLLPPSLTYEQICRYRIVIEPAAILEPTFILNRAALEECYAEQVGLFDRDGADLSPVEVFEKGSKFHQVVLACSNNPFFTGGLDQANRMRRLSEYTQTLRSPHWLERCRQHARIAALLLADDRAGAAALMRAHLEEGMQEKSPTR